jgi:hypothetical protein
MTKFEVGKFYAVQVGAWSRKKIPSLCTRTTKCTVTFQYLCKRLDGRIVKESCRRRKRIVDGVERTYDTEKWSLIVDTFSNELADKPKRWDEVTEVVYND